MNDGGPAFPNDSAKYWCNACCKIFPEQVHHGMTLRDYFAAKAMQGLIAHYGNAKTEPQGNQVCTESAYKFADAMLVEREK